MPRKNSVKIYVENGYYHIYNRGIDKRAIFRNRPDFIVFLRFLKEYLLPPNHPHLQKLQGLNPRRKPVNCSHQIKLLAYCLMPNHFHLFIKQKTPDGLKTFMKALAANYGMYFNHKYHREGPLFQGTYKAVLITTEPYYLHISRYIHRNPLELLSKDQALKDYQYSSYPYYLTNQPPDWLDTEEVLEFFPTFNTLILENTHSYQSFVEDYKQNDRDTLTNLSLD